MSNVLIVAPHPDDEILGCGGVIYKHKNNGDQIHWLIVTHIFEEQGFSKERISTREKEIYEVANKIEFNSVNHLKFPTAQLDTIPTENIISSIGKVVKETNAQIVYVPYRGDIHSDHHIVFDATVACTKWFRYPTVEKVLVYETLSETDFVIDPDTNGFRPNVFVDISEFLEKKIENMNIYKSEIAPHPFPRSEQAIRALATLRGAAAGVRAAEAFMLVKERVL